MIPNWYIERPDLSAEVCSLMMNSSLTVYENRNHNCFHIFRGYDELVSVKGPWGDAAKDELRHYAFIAQNGMSNNEDKLVRDGLKSLEERGDEYQRDAVAQMVKNVTNYAENPKLYFYNK